MVEFEKRAPLRSQNLSLGMLAGLLLIIAGVLLFLDRLGILPFRLAGLFWPLVFLAWGGATISTTRSTATTVWSCTAIIAGILLGLSNFGILHVSFGALWPLTLIASGVIMLIYRVRWEGLPRQLRYQVGANTKSRAMGNILNESAVFSAVKRRIETQNFEGGELVGVFGGVEIDLRRAGVSSPDRQAVIEAYAVFGGIELRIPETWRVVIEGTAVFGAYEDKTIPPRPEPGIENPILIIRGGTAFGAVTVQN